MHNFIVMEINWLDNITVVLLQSWAEISLGGGGAKEVMPVS